MKAKTGLIQVAVAALGLMGSLLSFGLVGADSGTNSGTGGVASKSSPRPALAVTLVAPVATDWPRLIEASGGLYAWQEGVIAAETGGMRVVEVAVDVGDKVRRGQVLARLNDSTVKAEVAQQQARVAQIRAALAEALANGERARNVKNKGAMSEQQINQYLIAEEAAKANLAAAEAALEMERIRLDQTRVLAVDDGVISVRSATLGTVVQAGTELFRMVRQGRVEWRAELTAEQLAQIRPGQEARVRLPGGGIVTGKVRIQSPSLDANTRYGLVYVELPTDSPARPGMFAQGEIRVGASQALTLPESAVVLRDGSSYVFEVLTGDRVAQRKVETGRRGNGRVEVLSGLDTAARVVESGGAFLNDGDLVRVEPGAVAGKGESIGGVRQ
jgi:RND family efflux transporter MFP subunit